MRHIISCFISALLLISIHTSAQSMNTGSVTAGAVTLTEMPSVYFVGKNLQLTDQHRLLLTRIAKVIRNNPDYRFSLTGYCVGKYQIQQSGLRINSIMRYLVEKQGISQDRFEQIYGSDGGDCQTIDFKAIKLQ